MTLAWKLSLKLAALTLSLVLMAGVSMWGYYGLLDDVQQAADEYRELRMIQRSATEIAQIKGAFESAPGNPHHLVDHLEQAIEHLEAFLAFQETQREEFPDHAVAEQADCEQTLKLLRDLAGGFRGVGDGSPVKLSADQARSVDMALAMLERLTASLDATIAAAQTSAATRLRRTCLATGALSVTILAVAIWLNISQYRSVMIPLRRLRKSVRTLVDGRFRELVEATGDREFVELAEDFNRMAGELDGLYRHLEDKVLAKSRELVRSERLASVGFLAAGVAHEINNPLNIISGHAELCLKRIEKNPTAKTSAETCRSLEIIRDEAFRCKGIIEKLLSLSRGGENARQPVHIARLAGEIAGIVGDLKRYRQRSLEVHCEHPDDLVILANESEMRQVLLNLVINALEAVGDHLGRVTVSADRQDNWVQLVVEDNGVGMTSATIERIFEPFYTEYHGEQRGTGLGLSISHAIIESHGGQIRAHSEGPGRGSRFVIRLPILSAGVTSDGQAA